MIYRFDRCELDVARHVFRIDGAERALEPQVFDLLHLLARRPGLLVSRDDLVDAIWGGRIVSEATISARINAARRAVNDDGQQQRVLRTVSRRGIQMVCPVAALDDDPAPAAPTPVRPVVEQRVRFAHSFDGTPIAYTTTGQGPPLVRVDHWLTHLEQDWHSPVRRPFLNAIAADFAVTRYDQRGCGLSARNVEHLNLDVMIDDLEAVVDAARVDRFPIYAACQGVPIAVGFAARRPERVSRMILYGGYAVGRRLRGEAQYQAEAEAVRTLIETGWGRPGSAFINAYTALFMPEATREQIDSFIDMQLASANPQDAIRLGAAIDNYDVRNLLPQLNMPVLVVHARNDAVQPLDQARLLAAAIPDAEMVVLETKNHIPLPQDPTWDRLVGAILSFAGARGEYA